MPIQEAKEGVYRLSVGDASCEVALFGSTVTSWYPSTSPPSYSALFLSSATQSGKAYRGGVPIVFPLFGEVTDHKDIPEALKKVPRHGFCRDRKWKLVNKQDDETSASISMGEYRHTYDRRNF